MGEAACREPRERHSSGPNLALNGPGNFRLIINRHRSAKSQNLATISTVDFEIIGLTGIVKNK